MKTLFSLLLSLSLFANGYSQCVDGALVANCGGCQSGCDLTAFGGPNCADLGNPTGNCGSPVDLSVDIVVPEGCVFTVTAQIGGRPSACNSGSGADNGDNLKVDIPGGVKSMQNGSSNNIITDSYTLTGPGIIRVSSRVNRIDEITTYTVTSTGAGGDWTCPDCINNLPIELLEFKATANVESVDLTWATATEKNNDYFTIERSKDGLEFETISVQSGQGNSTSVFRYKTMDYSPLFGRSYYRLKQTDYDGNFTYSRIETVVFEPKEFMEIYPNPAHNQFNLRGKNINQVAITISNSLGQLIDLIPQFENNELTYNVAHLKRGTYIIKGVFMESIVVKKLVIN